MSARFSASTLDRRAAASTVEYGGRYARYDYLETRRPPQPARRRVGRAVPRHARRPRRWRSAWSRPGAEEFLSPASAGPWLPPERTFAPLGGPGDPDTSASSARARSTSPLEHEFDGAYVVGVRRFYQSVDDQLVTLFGLNLPEGPDSVGHYYVASAGAVDADGWAFRLSTTTASRVQRLDRLQHHAARTGCRAATSATSAPWAPAAIRPETEELHDITTSVETDIPETATRVFVLYKVNTGYARVRTLAARASTAGSTCRSIRRCRSSSPAPSGKCSSACGTCSATPTTRLRLRRAARRPPAQAGRRRLPRPVLEKSSRRSSVCRCPCFLNRSLQIVGSRSVSNERDFALKSLITRIYRGYPGVDRERPLLRHAAGHPSCQLVPFVAAPSTGVGAWSGATGSSSRVVAALLVPGGR